MNEDIKYSGFAAVPADYECPDGQLATAINCIPENGALQPILPPKVIKTLANEAVGNKSFIHETSLYTHYIVYAENSRILYFASESSSSATPVGGDYSYVYGVKYFNAIGNVLMAFTDTDIHYFLWKGSSYAYLGNHLPQIDISFGLVGHPRLFSVSDSSKSQFTIYFDGIDEGNIRSEFSDNNKTRITEQIMAKVNKFIREQTIDKGRFCFPFFVRYALRMYDGSLVCHSAPILMNPSTLPAPIALWSRAHGKKSYTEATCDIMLVAADLDYQVIHNSDFYKLDDWKDLITGIEVFISKPIYTYDQEGKISRLTDNDNFDCKFIGKLYHSGYYRGGAPQFANSVSEDKILGPVTATANVDNTTFLNHYMEWTYKDIYALYFSANRTYPGESFHMPEYTDGKISESLKNCSTFYKLCTISFEDAKNTSRKTIPIENDYLQSLVTREVMTDDYLTHDRLCAQSSQSYNSRLNLSGVKRTPFSGFSAMTMFAYCNKAKYSWKLDGTKVIVGVPMFHDYVSITVFIKENGRVHRVDAGQVECADFFSDMRYHSDEDAQNQTNGFRLKMSWGVYFFYPNVNAIKMIVSANNWVNDDGSLSGGYGGGSFTIDLRPHDFLNGAYALLDYEQVRRPNYNASDIPSVVSPYEQIDCSGKVYTSEVNNPFFFPVTGINTVGTGRILGIATAAKALSEGQFGQFPLYAFTTEGVWAMEVSSTGTYSAKQPITRDVCINSDGITQIDSAVLFPTDRGIMLISGSQTQCISEPLNSEYPFNALDLPSFAKLHGMIHEGADTCLPTLPFTEFLKQCRMIYDYVHQRIIVYAPGVTYAYVYSMKSQQWGMTFSSIVSHLNSYPEALAVDKDNNIVNFSESDAEQVGCLYVTRPLKLGQGSMLKTIDTIIQRGNFARGHVATVLYGSRDLINWHLVWSSKDHYLRGFRGTPYKFFRIAGVANLNANENIIGASVQFTPRLTNQPR